MRKFKINLDDIQNELLEEMKRLSAVGNSGEFVIEAENPLIAAENTAELLVPFLKRKIVEI